MKIIWMYSVAASNDPDKIHCVVPWRVDEKLIFFGPCKKRMREHLRAQFLGNGASHALLADQLYIVGVNGGNPSYIRKVVWWGRVSEVMTFCEADKRLQGNRFRLLRGHAASPLHVRPIIEKQVLIGYEHVSYEHRENDAWISDLVSKPEGVIHLRDERKILLRHGRDAWEVFDRDCCMLLENRFFAQKNGIEFDEEALKILRDAQPKKRDQIDGYAVFGRNIDQQANGLRGTYLKIDGSLADRFIAWLEGKEDKRCPDVNSPGNIILMPPFPCSCSPGQWIHR